MSGNKCSHSEKGYGVNIFDSGIAIENCEFSENKEGGLYAKCFSKPNKYLSQEVSAFLEKYPLKLMIKDSVFTNN